MEGAGAGGRGTALPETPFLGRVRIRMGMGRGLPAQLPGLLPQTGGGRAVLALPRTALAGCQWPGPRQGVRGAGRGVQNIGARTGRVLTALAVHRAGPSRVSRDPRIPYAHRLPVPLAQSRLSRLRRLFAALYCG